MSFPLFSIACALIISIWYPTNVANHNTTYSLHEKGHPLGCPSKSPTTATRCRIRSTARPRDTDGQAPQAQASATYARSLRPRNIPRSRARRFPQCSNLSPDGTSACTLPRAPFPFSLLSVACGLIISI